MGTGNQETRRPRRHPVGEDMAELERACGITDCRNRFLGRRTRILEQIGKGRNERVDLHDTERLHTEHRTGPDELEKEIRFALSTHFLENFWARRQENVLCGLRAFIEADLKASSPAGRHELLVDLFLTEGLSSEDAVPLQTLQHLSSALELMSRPRTLQTIDDVRRLIQAHSWVVLSKVIIEACYWEHDAHEFLDSRAERHLWQRYLKCLARMSNYASPADHIRAGIEGYALIFDRLTLEVPLLWGQGDALARFGPVAYEHALGDAALRFIRRLSSGHMQAFVGLDHLIRTSRAETLLFERAANSQHGIRFKLPTHSVDRVRRASAAFATEDNVRARNRIGCPFFLLSAPAIADLHNNGFMSLARKGIFPRAREIADILRARVVAKEHE